MTSAIRHSRRRVTALLGAGALIAAGLVVPATAAHAAVACDVTYQANHWTERPGAGGFQADVTITNLGDPIDGWTLSFALPAGQTFRHGWGGQYTILPPGGVSVGNLPWNAQLGTGQSTWVGFLGTWSGSFTVPTTFRVNGVVCDGAEPPENQPPTVTLTSPAPGAVVLIGRTLTLAATAGDPDGAVDRVEFLVDGTVVATDDTAPYEASVPVSFTLGQHTATARAADNGSPPLAATSDPVSFSVISLPPLGSIIEPAALEIAEGGTGTVTVRLDVSAATQDITMTVSGAPGVTVSPATFRLEPANPVQQVTVTAAPDSGGQVAQLAATGPSLTSTGRTTVTVRDVIVDERVANPYAGAQVYVDPDWAAQALDQATVTPGELGRQMAEVATQPTAVWLDSIESVTEGRGLAGHLATALAQQQASGATAMLVQLVLYNLPGRDCMQRGAPPQLTVDPFDVQRYRTAFIDPIVEILGRPEYADLRVVTVVEPQAIPSLVLATQARPFPPCTGFVDAYIPAVQYALHELTSLTNTYAYLDFSFNGHMGYPDNFGPTADLYTDLIFGPGGPGAGAITGFVTNVRQYAPLREPFIDAEEVRNGVPLYQTLFLDFNRVIHEEEFAQAARTALIQRGFPPNIGMVIDTSRNGWGGPDRPTAPSLSQDAGTYVEESRIDKRPNRASWCNQIGAGLGERPRSVPAPGIHSYAWITPPGESDGVAERDLSPDPDRPWLIHRDQCDPDWQAPQGALILSGALPGAPHYGSWFPEFFAQLVSNAHPPVPTA